MLQAIIKLPEFSCLISFKINGWPTVFFDQVLPASYEKSNSPLFESTIPSPLLSKLILYKSPIY